MTQPLPQPTGSSWGQDPAGEQPAAQPEATAARPWYKKKRFLIPGGLVALLVVGGVMGQGGDADPTASSPVETTEVDKETSDAAEDAARVEAKEAAAEDAARIEAEQAERAEAEDAARVEAEQAEQAERAEAEDAARVEAEQAERAEAAEAEAAEAAAAGTVSQQNALRSAESYLDFTAFSRTGLIEQLEYEQFSTEDATWAVDRVTVDWDEQAALSAEDYLDFMGFSRSGLIEQLIYEGFTPEQAEHGVNQTGL